jgi:hypothetical protein
MTEDDRLYNLEFGVEVSTLYHEWRRATFEGWAVFIRVIALTGSVVALVSFFALDEKLLYAVAIASAFVAIVTLVDLAFRIDYKARLHTDLYQRFKRLQVAIALHRSDWQSHFDEWNAEAQMVRVDEPPVFWAIYMDSWNQALQKRRVDPTNLRRVTLFQRIWGRIYNFRPQDFPLVGAKI